jgi:viroplasmin and RNaseH domain-containing protein
MAHNFYAVKRGFDKATGDPVVDRIFTDWATVKPLVIGYEDARYKGFDTEEEAKVWLEVVDKTDAEKRSKKTIDKAKKEIGVEPSELVKDVHEIADDYADTLNQLLNEYKKLDWSLDATIGHLTHVLINEATKVYK